MVYRGRVKRGVVVLEGAVGLPEGMAVTVEPVEEKPGGSSGDVYQLERFATSTGILDLALNLDHYLYGHPKQDDAYARALL